MVHMLDEETSLMKRGEKGTGSLMTSLVRALGTHHNEEAAAKIKDDQKSKGLTVDEILGCHQFRRARHHCKYVSIQYASTRSVP